MTIQETAALLRQQDDILILTHRRPDGDTIGCAAALCAALRRIGKRAWILYNEDITATNAIYAEPYWASADVEPKFVVSVDIADRQLFFPSAEKYLGRVDLAIDHHPSKEYFGRGRSKSRGQDRAPERHGAAGWGGEQEPTKTSEMLFRAPQLSLNPLKQQSPNSDTGDQFHGR